MALSKRAYMIDEFLLRPAANGRQPVATLAEKINHSPLLHPSVLFHAHCYQKVQPPAADGFPSGPAATVALLEACGYQVNTIPDGCCGMAGAFGYEAEHYELSVQIGAMALFPAISSRLQDNAGCIVTTAGVSCQAQIKDGTGVSSVHPIVLVAQRVRGAAA
jgi:Fe-S oxidoreductase